MKLSNLSKIAGASALALSLAVLPSTLPASAQTGNTGNTGNSDRTGVTIDRTPFQETKGENSDGNWGLLGLLGLIGLANLFRKDEPRVVTRDRDDVMAGPGPRM